MTKTTKQIAIELAERLGDKVDAVFLNRDSTWAEETFNKYVDTYLRNKAADILFQEGMADRICEYLLSTDGLNIGQGKFISWWRTLTPIKVIEVYLAMEEG